MIDRFPLPWRVNPAYSIWRESGSHRVNPTPILAADDDGSDDRRATILDCSEWLTIDDDVLTFIVNSVNRREGQP